MSEQYKEQYSDSIFWVEVERIKPNPYQPRREFDEASLKELAESIRMYGLLQPLTVTRNEIMRDDGGIFVEYELIAGERRLRASKLAGLAQVPVIIRTGEQTNQMKLELAIIENLQREDLNPLDRARALEKLSKEFGFKHSDIGKKVGKSREYVSNSIRLLLLPENIQEMVAGRQITEGHTRPIMMLQDRPEEQQVLAKEILIKKLTVREAEAIARRIAQDKVRKDKYAFNPEILELERKLADHLGTRVHIEPREVGGRVVISFFSPDDLRALIEIIDRKEAEALSHTALTSVSSVEGARAQESLGAVLSATDSDTNTESTSVDTDTDTDTEAGDIDLLDDRSRQEREAMEEELYSIRNFSI